jgi:hypothetical protein
MGGKKASKGAAAAHRCSVTDEEFAIVNWLRTHPTIAAKYGIHECNGHTRVAAMLVQMLAWMGAVVEWKATLGAAADGAADGTARKSTARAVSAEFLSSLKPRPGRKPAPDPQPALRAPPEAAINRKNPRKRGRPPKISFPLLVRLSKQRKRRREFVRLDRDVDRVTLVDARLAACQVDAGAGRDSHVVALIRDRPGLHLFHRYDNDRRADLGGRSELVASEHLPPDCLLTALVPADAPLLRYASRTFD